MEPRIAADSTLDDDRVRAAQMLANAQRNPVLSAEQSCAVAQVHAVLAIERRLAHLCAKLDAVLAALINAVQLDDHTLVRAPSALLS
jgi:hypothetical protein